MKSNQLTNMRENTAVWIMLIYFSMIGLFLIIGRYLFWDEAIQVIELIFSPDRQLEKNGISFIDQIIVPFIAFHIGLGLIGWILLFSKPWLVDSDFYQVEQSDHARFNLFIISSLLALYLFGLYNIPDLILGIRLPIFLEDSFFETMTAVNLFVSGILFFLTILYVRKDGHTRQKLVFIVIFLFLTLICILGAGEEISWGQRVFGWDTPEQIAIYNTKNETNLHNFLPPVTLDLFERGAIIIFSIILFGVWLGNKNSQHDRLSMIIPPIEMYIAVLMMIVSSGITGELLEEMTSLFILIYSIWILRKWKFRGKISYKI